VHIRIGHRINAEVNYVKAGWGKYRGFCCGHVFLRGEYRGQKWVNSKPLFSSPI
jgi:hypothetical protein